MQIASIRRTDIPPFDWDIASALRGTEPLSLPGDRVTPLVATASARDAAPAGGVTPNPRT